MKVTLISCFGYYEQRVRFVKEAFEEHGDEVKILFSDFDHINKTNIKDKIDGIEYLHARAYRKNMTLSRIYSHYRFSIAAFKRVQEERPDLVYAVLPPNSLGRLLKGYKAKNKVKLIYDIYDLWPESFVNKKLERVAHPLFNGWRNLRNKSLDIADYVITECDLYQEILKDFIIPEKTKTIYLTKLRESEVNFIKKPMQELRICYLGSINNIIHTAMIKEFLVNLNKYKPVILEVIGKGETKDYFMKIIKQAGIRVIDHGTLYGLEKKAILERCHFGINMMIDAAKVGLTMKSVDYFEANLPLINNIKGDTWSMIETNHIGFNIMENTYDFVAKEIAKLTEGQYLEIARNTKKVFEHKFSHEAFKEKFYPVISEIHEERMNFLIVSQYYYPEQFRITDVCENLVKKGHSVTVLTGLPNYPEGIVLDRYKKFKNRRENLNGVNVIRSFLVGRGKTPFKLFLNYLSFMVCASFKKRKLPYSTYDAIFVYEISPVTQIYPAVVYQKKFNCPLFVNCQDVWPEVIKVYGIKDGSWLFKAVKKFSKYLYKKADSILVSSKGFLEYLHDVCEIPMKDMKYLPNHAEDLYLQFNNKTDRDDKIHFLFAGNIGIAQNLITLIHAIAGLPNEIKHNIVIDIVGDGSYLPEFKDKVRVLHIESYFKFHGKKKLNELKTFYEEADAFIMTLEGGTFVSNTVPAKLQGYMGAGKPILAAIDGQSQHIIQEAKCGFYCNAGDHKAFSKMITDFIINIEKYREMGDNGRRYFSSNFTVDIYVNRLINMMREER